MEYVRDFEKIRKRLELRGENEARCCIAVTAPKAPAPPISRRYIC